MISKEAKNFRSIIGNIILMFIIGLMLLGLLEILFNI